MTDKESMELSIIMPVRNGGSLFPRALSAILKQQCYASYEVVVVNNGSTDQTLEVARDFAQEDDRVHVINAPNSRCRADAINEGLARIEAPLVATLDHDDIVSAQWVQAMVDALAVHPIVSGNNSLQPEPISLESFQGAVFSDSPPTHGGFMPYALGCNFGFSRSLAIELNGFDPSMSGAEDIDFAWRAQLRGHSLGFAREAKVLKSVRTPAKDRFRQHVFYAQADLALQRRFRPVGYQGVRLRALKKLGWLGLHVPFVARSPEHRSRWSAVAGDVAGTLMGTLKRA